MPNLHTALSSSSVVVAKSGGAQVYSGALIANQYVPVFSTTISRAALQNLSMINLRLCVEIGATIETVGFIPYLIINGSEALHGDRQNILTSNSRRQLMLDGLITVDGSNLVTNLATVCSFMSTGTAATHGIWGDVALPTNDFVVEFGVMVYSVVTSVTITRKPCLVQIVS